METQVAGSSDSKVIKILMCTRGRVGRIEKKKNQGAPGIEPGTSRSAVECSTTELHPQLLYNGPV